MGAPAEVDLDVGDDLVVCLGGTGSAVELVVAGEELRPGRTMAAFRLAAGAAIEGYVHPKSPWLPGALGLTGLSCRFSQPRPRNCGFCHPWRYPGIACAPESKTNTGIYPDLACVVPTQADPNGGPAPGG